MNLKAKQIKHNYAQGIIYHNEFMRLAAVPYGYLNLSYFDVNPSWNRKYLRSMSFGKAGIYAWISPCGRAYIGRSINLYSRVRSYYHATPKSKGISLIRNYLNAHGFKHMHLALYLVPQNFNFNQLVALEQAFFDCVKPSLNLDKHATTTKYNAPMGVKTYEQFKAKRSIAVKVYVKNSKGGLNLLMSFKDKQTCMRTMRIHHTTLNRLLASGELYLNTFFLSVNNSEPESKVYDLKKLLKLLAKARKAYARKSNKQSRVVNVQNKHCQIIYAQNAENPKLTGFYGSQRACASALKADRATLR